MSTEDLKSLVDELDGVIAGNRDLLNAEPRIGRPIQEARDAAKTKYDDRVQEGK